MVRSYIPVAGCWLTIDRRQPTKQSDLDATLQLACSAAANLHLQPFYTVKLSAYGWHLLVQHFHTVQHLALVLLLALLRHPACCQDGRLQGVSVPVVNINYGKLQ